MICFEHIPKTSGKSLNLAFESIYLNKYVNIDKYRIYSDNYFSGAEFVSGHRSVETLKLNGLTPNIKITFLRNPLTLLPSTYYHLLRSFSNITNFKARIFGKGPRYLLENKRYIMFDNGIIRRLINYNGDPFTINRSHLEKCKKYLNEFKFIGFQEEFLSSIFLLSNVLNWNHLPVLTKMNAIPVKHKYHSIYEKDEAFLLQLNKYDIQLYNYFFDKYKMITLSSDYQLWQKIKMLTYNDFEYLKRAFYKNKFKTSLRS